MHPKLSSVDIDCILAKISTIKKCLTSISTVTADGKDVAADWQAQDVTVVNLQRAIQGCIDISQVLLAAFRLELPRSYKNAFQILADAKLISGEVSKQMQSMVGFRNIAVHDYQELNLDILKSVLSNNLNDFEKYTDEILVLIK